MRHAGAAQWAYTDLMRRMQLHAESTVRQRTGAAPPRPWLEGAHPWGSFDATVGQYGVRRYHLTVYAPGGTAVDRLLSRVWRGWPLAGAGLGLLAVMLLGNVVAPPSTVVEWALAAYVGIGGLLFWRAGPARVPVRSLSVILIPKGADAVERRRHAQWASLVAVLTRADHLLADGSISVVDHEAVWWTIYDELGSIADDV